ncbi:MAG TPA: DUF1634 domain-containing protein [Gemmataceae bacterium]|nr:DUF1634 domain-containing protein [Gemmataceae bacterium]
MSEQLHPGPSEERVEQVMGNLLRIGVIASAVMVFLGGLLYLIHEGRWPAPDLHEFHAQPEHLRSPAGILRESAALKPSSLIMLGLLLLIATPVARVIFSVAAFVLQRDYLYVFFTILVLSVLLYSLFSGYLSGSGAL